MEGRGIVVAVGAVIEDEKGRVLLVKHVPERKGFWQGKWICPGGGLKLGESIEHGIKREVWEETGLVVRPGRALNPIRHAYTHFRMTLHVLPCSTPIPAETPKHLVCRWIDQEDLNDCPLSRAEHKVLERLELW